MVRTPPAAVRRQLRREVGFRCPVIDCGIPYLTYHHFDPPWSEEHHHRPEGMIALCRLHADSADGGAYTRDQLLRMKDTGATNAEAIRGEFDWMRRELLVIAGGNFYWATPTILRIGSRRCIWLDRDEQEYLRVNFCMPTVTSDDRAYLVANGWVVPPSVSDLECPPRGRRLLVRYTNGDRFQVAFSSFETATAVAARYPSSSGRWANSLTYPLTAVEVWETVAGTSLEFGPAESRIGGVVMRNNFAANSGVGIQVEPAPVLHLPQPDDEDSG